MDGDVLVIVIALDRQATVVDGRVARSHTVQASKVFGQPYIEGIVVPSHDADVIGIADCSRTAFDVQSLAQVYGHIFAVITLELAATVHLVADSLQLVFCSSPAALDVFPIPFLVIETIQIIAVFRVAVSRCIGLLAQSHSAVTGTNDYLAFRAIHRYFIRAVTGRDFGAVAVDGNLFGCIRFITECDVVIQVDRMVVLHGDVLAALGFDRFSRLTGFFSGDFLHIADAGRVVVSNSSILLAVDAASDIGNLLGSAVDALIRNGDVTDFDLVGFHAITVDGGIPGLEAAVVAQNNILLQGDFQGITVHLGFDILVITLDGNGFAQILLYGAAFFIGQSEAAFVLAGNVINSVFQLTFRSGPHCLYPRPCCPSR